MDLPPQPLPSVIVDGTSAVSLETDVDLLLPNTNHAITASNLGIHMSQTRRTSRLIAPPLGTNVIDALLEIFQRIFPKPTPSRPILGDTSKGERRGLLQDFLELVKVGTCLKGACAALKFAGVDVWEEGVDSEGEKVDNKAILLQAFGYERGAYGILQFHPQVAMGYRLLARDCENEELCYGCLREKRWEERDSRPKTADRSSSRAGTPNSSVADDDPTTACRQRASSMEVDNGLSTAGNLQATPHMDLPHERMKRFTYTTSTFLCPFGGGKYCQEPHRVYTRLKELELHILKEHIGRIGAPNPTHNPKLAYSPHRRGKYVESNGPRRAHVSEWRIVHTDVKACQEKARALLREYYAKVPDLDLGWSVIYTYAEEHPDTSDAELARIFERDPSTTSEMMKEYRKRHPVNRVDPKELDHMTDGLTGWKPMP